MDSRIIDLADMLVHSALSIQKNENVLIETTDTPDALSVALVRAVARAGARPFLTQNRSAVHRALLQNASDEQMKIAAEHDLNFMKQMQVYSHSMLLVVLTPMVIWTRQRLQDGDISWL